MYSLEIVQTIGCLRRVPQTDIGLRSSTETADCLDDFETDIGLRSSTETADCLDDFETRSCTIHSLVAPPHSRVTPPLPHRVPSTPPPRFFSPTWHNATKDSKQAYIIIVSKSEIFQCILIWVQGPVELGNLRHFSQFWEFSLLSSTYNQLLYMDLHCIFFCIAISKK